MDKSKLILSLASMMYGASAVGTKETSDKMNFISNPDDKTPRHSAADPRPKPKRKLSKRVRKQVARKAKRKLIDGKCVLKLVELPDRVTNLGKPSKNIWILSRSDHNDLHKAGRPIDKFLSQSPENMLSVSKDEHKAIQQSVSEAHKDLQQILERKCLGAKLKS